MKKPALLKIENKKSYFEIDMLKIVNYFNYLLDKYENKEFDTIDITLSKSNYYIIRVTFYTSDCKNTTIDIYNFYSIDKIDNLITLIEKIFKSKYVTLEEIKNENDKINNYTPTL